MGLILSLDNSIHSFNTGKFVLDQYTGAAAAYSLRRLSVNTTNVVRVRRSSDNAEDDFTATEVVDGTLTSFVGGQNLCLQSEDINTTWTAGSTTTPTQDTEITPDGDSTNKYIKIIDDGSTGTGSVFIRQYITLLANTKYTASVFLKANQLSFARINATLYDTGTSGSQFFDLSGAGSLGTAVNLDDSMIEVYPNGWYRCSITFTTGANPSGYSFVVNAASSISSTTVDLDGTSSIFVWGAQVNEGATAGDYAPTTSNISGYGYVTTWYDQAGSNDATQGTAANQPKIVDAGVLVEENGKPSISFDGVDDKFQQSLPNDFYGTKDIYFFAVTKNATSSETGGITQKRDGALDGNFGVGSITGQYEFISRDTATALASLRTTSTYNTQEIVSVSRDSSGLQMYSPETLTVASAVADLTSTGVSEIGFGGSFGSLEGIIQEIIIFDSDQSSNRTGIETNINNHYNIYP